MAVCMRQSMRLVVGGVRGWRGFRVLCPYEMCARARGISEMKIGISEMKISIVAVFSLQSTTPRRKRRYDEGFKGEDFDVSDIATAARGSACKPKLVASDPSDQMCLYSVIQG